MGSDLTVFLEFYGLPGCGKSTISHLVAEELRKQGKKVIEPTYDLDHKYSAGKRKVLKFLKLLRFAAGHPCKCWKLRKLIKANGYSGLEVISHAANITPKLWIYEKSKEDFVIFDEGLTQSAISLCQGERSSVENEVELYSLCKKRNVRKLYIKIDIETALRRMVGRDKHDSRIEKIKDSTEQKKAILSVEEQCNRISFSDIVFSKTIENTVHSIIVQFDK